MDYTLETLIKLLKSRLQNEEFDEEILTSFINQAQSEILGEDKYPFMQRIDRYSADGKGQVDLPLDYGGTFYIFAEKDGKERQELQYVSPEEFFDHTGRHTLAYTVFANTLFYRIYKDDGCDGFTITHLYLENPRPLSDPGDRSPIPPEYIEALILGALYRAEQLRDNFDYAQIYQNQQDQLLTNMKLRYGPGNLTASNRAKLPFNGGNYDARI